MQKSTTPLSAARPYHLLALTLTLVLSRLAQYLMPIEPTFRGQPVGVWVAVLGSALTIALALWMLLKGRKRGLPPTWLALMASLVLAWASTLALAYSKGDLFSITTILVPVTALAILICPPSREDLQATLVFFSLVTLSAAVVTIAAAASGLRPFREDFAGRIGIPILDAFRWEFFFGDANNAGSSLAVIVLIGLYRRGRVGIFIGSAAAILLLLTQSRTGIVAAVLGASIMLAGRWTGVRQAQLKRLLVLGFISFLLILGVILMDPSLNGRVPIWREYWQLWGQSPSSGLGFQGIQAQVPDLTGLAQDAHNVVLDSLVRYGVVPAFFGTAFLVLAGFVVLSVGFRDQGFPVAVYVTSMACFMTYTTFGWSYMTVFLWPFMLAVFLAAEDRAPGSSQLQFVARPPERTSQ